MAQDTDGNVLAVAVALAVLCVVAVGIRFHARVSKQLGLKIDDWLCLPALVFTVICCSLTAAGSTYSISTEHLLHDPDVLRNPNIIQLQKLSFAFITLQPLALGFTKASILFFYRRIFCGKAFDFAWWSLIVLVSAWTFGFFFASLLQCGGNIHDFWTTTSEATRCYALSTSGAFITTDVLLDLMMVTLPIPLVLRLQMPFRSRLIACVIFLAGGASIPVAIARLAFFAKVQQNTPSLLSQVWGVIMFDVTGFNGIALFCPTVELGVALIAACEPSINVAYGNGNGSSPDNSAEIAWRQLVEKHAHHEPGDIALAPVQTWPQMMSRSNTFDSDNAKKGDEGAIFSLKEIL